MRIKKDEKGICGNYYLIARFERSGLLGCPSNPFTRADIDEKNIVSDKEMADEIAHFVKHEQDKELQAQHTCAVTVTP